MTEKPARHSGQQGEGQKRHDDAPGCAARCACLGGRARTSGRAPAEELPGAEAGHHRDASQGQPELWDAAGQAPAEEAQVAGGDLRAEHGQVAGEAECDDELGEPEGADLGRACPLAPGQDREDHP